MSLLSSSPLLLFSTLLLLPPPITTFNIDTRGTTITSADVTPGGHFGWSMAATTGDVVYVGAPKAEDGVGAIYKCQLSGIDFSVEQHSTNTLCNKISIPLSPDPRVNNTNQGLGESMAVHHSSQRLLVCLPRRKSKYKMCRMSSTVNADLRGICYELDTVTDKVTTVHDNCRSDPWTELPAPTILQFGQTKYGCLQVQVDETVPTFGAVVFHLTGGSSKSLVIQYNPTTTSFTISYPGIDDNVYNCEHDGLGFYYSQTTISKGIELNCYGRNKTFVDLPDTALTATENIELTGFTKYWLEEYHVISSEHIKESLELYDNCMYGYNSFYHPATHEVVVSAPGYNRTDSTPFRGAVFVGAALDPHLSSVHNVTEKGLVYHAVVYKSGITWSAVSGHDESTGSLTGCVIISRDGAVTQIIPEPGFVTGFGHSLLLWENSEVLQLLVGVPRDECGGVVLYTLNEGSGLFEHTTRIVGGSEVCDGFGYSLVNIGNIDGDSYTDVGVGTVYDNSVHILVGGQDGISESVMQVIRPQPPTTPYFNTFGYSMSRHDSLLVIGDPTGNKVHLYTTLPVWRAARTATCDEILDIDKSPVTCDICITLTGDYTGTSNVNLTVTWAITHPNITATSEIGSIQLEAGRGAESCAGVTFTRASDTDIRDFDLNTGIGITFSFSQFPDPLGGRIVAVDPRGLQPSTVNIETVGRCGKQYCLADFSLTAEYKVERYDEMESFRAITGKNDSVVYFGGSREVLVLDVTISNKSGVYLDEVLSVELNNTYLVNIPSEVCNSTQFFTTISLYFTSDRNMCTVMCEGDTFVRCTQTRYDDTSRHIQLRIPVVQNAYLTDRIGIGVTLKTQRNRDTNMADNSQDLNIPVFKFLEMGVQPRLQPSHLTNIRLRNYRSASPTLQGYGPEQTLTLELTNEGSSMVAMTSLSVIYPVIYRGDELMYIGNIASSAATFRCEELTLRQINYRNLHDINADADTPTTDKYGSLLVEPCQEDWKCVNLTCFVESLRPGVSTFLSVTTYLNVEYASNFLNVTIPITYSRSYFDTRFIASERVQYGAVDTVIEVTPGVVSTLWYVVGAFVGGSIILAVFIILLIKCGFFSRQRRDELKLMKHVVMEIDTVVTKGDEKSGNAWGGEGEKSGNAWGDEDEEEDDDYHVYDEIKLKHH